MDIEKILEKLDDNIEITEEYVNPMDLNIDLKVEEETDWFESVLDSIDLENKQKQTEREEIAKEVVKQMQSFKNNELDILEKEDIKEILHFKDDATALRFLRVAVKNGYGMKIGKSYKITKKNFEKMLRFLEGQEFDF